MVDRRLVCAQASAAERPVALPPAESECAVIHRILQNSAFTPEQIKLMSTAYEAALAQLKLRDRNDPLTLVIAKAVIDVAQTGERDPMSICTLALQRMESTAGESAASASMHP